jgi:soluble lytic murein transglycosylase-like protein
MTVKNTVRTILTTLVIFIFGCGYVLYNINDEPTEHEIYEMGSENGSPTSLHMYYLLVKASDKYKIPRHILFNVAYLETGYKGPFHWNYNPYQTSFAGAQGPMQIITRWSHSYAGRRLTPTELRTNLELNIDISCKMLVRLKRMYNRWDLALGYYNTGHPRVNHYAQYASRTYNYENKWIRPK